MLTDLVCFVERRGRTQESFVTGLNKKNLSRGRHATVALFFFNSIVICYCICKRLIFSVRVFFFLF